MSEETEKLQDVPTGQGSDRAERRPQPADDLPGVVLVIVEDGFPPSGPGHKQTDHPAIRLVAVVRIGVDSPRRPQEPREVQDSVQPTPRARVGDDSNTTVGRVVLRFPWAQVKHIEAGIGQRDGLLVKNPFVPWRVKS
jgi:hypothetical protein